MRVLLLSFSPDFGGTLDADLLVSQINYHNHTAMHIGMNDESLNVPLLVSFQPDVVSLFYSFRYPQWNTYTINRLLEIFNGRTITLCVCVDMEKGYQSWILQQYPSVSYVISGEGEVAWIDFLNRLQYKKSMDGCHNLTYRQDKMIPADTDTVSCTIVYPQNLNELPWADKSDIIRKKQKHTIIYATRGCLYSCNFCITQNTKKKFRERDIVDVVNEMEWAHKQHGIIGFHFNDSVLFNHTPYSLNRLEQFTSELKKRRLPILYTANFHPSFILLAPPKAVNDLLNTGLYAVLIGIESGNEEDLRLYNKYTNTSQNHRALRAWRDTGADYKIGFINMNPYSSFNRLMENGNFLYENAICFLFNLKKRYWMIRNTPLYYVLIQDGMVRQDFDLYGYKFAEPRLEAYWAYLNICQDKPLEKRINHIMEMIGYLYRLSCWLQDTIIRQLIVELRTNVTAILQEINEITFEFYRDSLNAAKQERLNTKPAMEMLAHYQSRIDKGIIAIDNLRKKFLYTMQKCNSSNLSFVNEYLIN